MLALLANARTHAARALSLAALVVVAASLPAKAFGEENWATQRATELCVQGDTHRDAGQVDVAVERYRQALELDPTFGPAYLALGRLREATGDRDEAERTYAAGIEHVSGFAEGYLARSALLMRASRGDEALVDLAAALALKPADIDVVRRVRDASIALGKLPLALATSRKLVELAGQQGDAKAEHDARVTVRALVEIIGFVDPVTDGETRNSVRRALARSPGAGISPKAKPATTGVAPRGPRVDAKAQASSSPHPSK